MVRGDATGDVVFYGKGAGKLPTASAVVADVIDCVKHFKARKYLFWEDAKPNYVADFGKHGNVCIRARFRQGQRYGAEHGGGTRLLASITPLLAKRPVQGEAGFTVENLTRRERTQR